MQVYIQLPKRFFKILFLFYFHRQSFEVLLLIGKLDFIGKPKQTDLSRYLYYYGSSKPANIRTNLKSFVQLLRCLKFLTDPWSEV